ncbi:MAG: UDP-N-acetylglucosamine 1-carboxyvinyltransferase, partial [Acidimicrobiia bacterium]
GAMGMKVSPTADGIWAFSRGKLTAVDIATLPYPGFATDFMPQAVALLCVAGGSGIVTENLFDGRFGFVAELARMGADVRTEGRHAVVRGVERLSGAPVRALDVRAGAALVLAGLAADGETEIHDVHHVDRGYRDLPATLDALGADVRRLSA